MDLFFLIFHFISITSMRSFRAGVDATNACAVLYAQMQCVVGPQ